MGCFNVTGSLSILLDRVIIYTVAAGTRGGMIAEWGHSQGLATAPDLEWSAIPLSEVALVDQAWQDMACATHTE